jgi:hypothetical protein
MEEEKIMEKVEQLQDLVTSINEKGVFKINFEWVLDTQANEYGTVIGLISGGWAGKAHIFELGSENYDFLDGILNVLNALSGLEELS